MNILRHHRTSLLLWALPVYPLLAGGYPLEEGKKFVQITGKYIYAESFYNPSGKKENFSATSDITANIFGEMGFAPKFSFIFNLTFYKYYVSLGPNDSTQFDIIYSGAGDSDIGFKYGLLNNQKVKSSAWLKFGVPLGLPFADERSDKSPIPLFSNDYPISLGVDFEMFPFEVPLATNITLGIKARNYAEGTGNYSDASILGLSLTYPYKKLLFQFSGYGEFSHYNGATFKDVSYFAYGPQFYARIEKNIGLTLGVEASTANVNTLSGMAYRGGMYFTY